MDGSIVASSYAIDFTGKVGARVLKGVADGELGDASTQAVNFS